MRVLIIDGNGKIGHVVKKILIENLIDIDNLTMENLILTIDNCITLNTKNIYKKITNGNYNYIINLARIINQDAEENIDKAIVINSLLPHYIEKVTKKTKTKIISLSTDCVFSGENGPYTENDIKDGTSTYALTKSIGEIINNKDLTIRTSIIGPDIDPNGNRLFNWFMMSKGDIKGYVNVMWNGVTSVEFAHILLKLMNSDYTGILHIGTDGISKYNLLKLMNEVFKNSKKKISSDNGPISNKILLDTKINNDIIISNYRDMLNEMKLWIKKNKEQYKHYFGGN